MKRWLIAGAVVLAGAIGVVALATASSGSGGKAEVVAANSPLRHEIVAHAIDSKWLSPGPSKLGDTLAAQVSDTDAAGHAIGTGDYTCTVVALNPDKLECWGTDAFTDGTVETQGEVARSALESLHAPFTTTVVGGSGAYTNVHGVIRWTIDRDRVGTGVFISQ
jgi:hypothetical protein